MSGDPEPRYVLHRVTPSEWVINDRRYEASDPRHVVASVYEYADTEVEVVWLRDLPLAVRYTTPYEVLEEVTRVQDSSRSTRPIPIPHLPPLLAT
ncbi:MULTISPECIES: hypothetical protein [Microbacterium]|uniref:Uncharacterized protein n=1 Tax=Microbacterium hydrocarbonoxydans TaxID=273678 RepID=A0A1H4L4V5_9MICO|nr:hypothetical protein [Microbacterium hydrocarbonoxydans]SEB65733.1 hypothetical protein SAMN04489807_1664 [Microbacterium hydrocarbonoxydans]